MSALSETEFEVQAERTLNTLVEQLEDLGHDDVEADLESGVLTIEHGGPRAFVVNSHRAARQIWMSAESSAWHFNLEAGSWRCSKTNAELFSLLSEKMSNALRTPVELKAHT